MNTIAKLENWSLTCNISQSKPWNKMNFFKHEVSCLLQINFWPCWNTLPADLSELRFCFIISYCRNSFCFSFIFISWKLITSQHCSGFCHTLTWISHGVTCIPHPDPLSYLPLHPNPLGLPSAPVRSTCLMHPTWAGDLFHYR